jgi:hypothetical protein
MTRNKAKWDWRNETRKIYETKRNFTLDETKRNEISLFFCFAKQAKFRETSFLFRIVSCWGQIRLSLHSVKCSYFSIFKSWHIDIKLTLKSVWSYRSWNSYCPEDFFCSYAQFGIWNTRTAYRMPITGNTVAISLAFLKVLVSLIL